MKYFCACVMTGVHSPPPLCSLMLSYRECCRASSLASLCSCPLSVHSCTTAEGPARTQVSSCSSSPHSKKAGDIHSQSEPESPSAPPPFPGLLASPSSLLQTYQPPLFMGQTSAVAAQGLCTCCLLWLEDSSLRYPPVTSFIASFGLCSKDT